MNPRPSPSKLYLPLAALLLAGAALAATAAHTPTPEESAEEFCPTCSVQVSVDGSFVHRQD